MNVLINIKLIKPMLLIMLLVLTAIPLLSVFVQPQTALQAAENWLRAQPSATKAELGTPTIKSYINSSFRSSSDFYDAEKAELPLLYLVEYPNGSFVLLSADDNSIPVLGYNNEAQTPKASYPPALLEWVQYYADQIAALKTAPIDLPEYQHQWQQLLRGRFTSDTRNERSVQPLMTTNWDQGWPYNELCPADPEGPGGHVYAGCVATAMAMVMKYWNHPTTGVGNNSYYAMGYGYQSANFGATTYLWDEMPDAVGGSNIPVATLLYHLGVSVNMGYAPDGSGAQSYDAADAMVDHFRYPQAEIVNRTSYSLANWNALLKSQIDNGSPVYYSGHGAGGGHAFVIDGYDTADYFHFNFGWSGSSNGYYYVTNINPSGDFNQSQSAIINTIPENYSIANTKVRMHAANATVGDYFMLRLNTNPILGSWNVNHYEFNLHYDHNFLNFNGADLAGTISAAGSVSVTNPEPGILAVSWNGPANLVGGGNLINFSFTPVDQG
ncbi:MAG: C10 family peptidase, partial [Candidatus Cloacimonetes bacterium]|nr:C10 family peptidase [Candidatus Cloacimonadota bacterium]